MTYKEGYMKFIILTAALMMAMSAMACPGGKDKEEDKDERISVIR
jgi:hypothetical protein